MRRKKEAFTEREAALQIIAAEEQGREFGLTNPLTFQLDPTSNPYYYSFTAWGNQLDRAFRRGVEQGRGFRRADLKAVCADELECDGES